MTTYRWTHSRPLRRNRADLPTVEQGDEFSPSESELRHFGDRMERVGNEPMEYERRIAYAESTADEHWKSAVSEVESGEADAYLDELEEVDDRTTVNEAIAGRREVLDDD